MKRWPRFGLLFVLAIRLFAQDKESLRIEEAGRVMEQLLTATETIPRSVLDLADCVLIIPSVPKFSAGTTGSYALGVMSCRGGMGFYGPWGSPVMVTIESNAAKVQLAGNATDFILLVVSPRAADQLLKGKVKLGSDVITAAGPTAKTASVSTKAGILSYAHARGLFAGISLEGCAIRPDNAANKNVYGSDASAQDIVFGKNLSVPESAKNLLNILQKASPSKGFKAVPK